LKKKQFFDFSPGGQGVFWRFPLGGRGLWIHCEARVVAKTANTTRAKHVLLSKQQILACVVAKTTNATRKTTNYYVKCCF